jgi:hypothetical protein
LSQKLQLLLKEIQNLEKAVEDELSRARKGVGVEVIHGKISFGKDVLEFHRSLKKGIVKYLWETDFLFIVSAPVIYAMILPAVAVDMFSYFYQAICFPIYRIPKVKRSEYIRFDRHKLSYLNGIEKMNCNFCSYFNGSLSYAREIASRTEQYWCPIRHAFALEGAHKRYSNFVEFGDALAYHEKLETLRRGLRTEQEGKVADPSGASS